jgi:DNA-binding SARP family transcriptional activator/TolB-like protein
MIRLRTLGSLDLRAADGTSMQPVLRQTKRLALLAYLAVEKPGQFHRRDHLLGLFWPDADQKGGRASLNQAVFFLRKYLGNDAILNRGDEEIALNPERVGCDAAEFQQHIAAGRFAEAMEVYGGPLLSAVFVGEAEGFEQWLETKRDTLNRSAMRACGALADAATDREDYGDVAHWLRRAIACFPFDESLHRRLITALDRAGDRAAALLAYDELEKTLKSEFESEPAAETKQLIQQVRLRSDVQTLPPERARATHSEDAVIPRAITAQPRRRLIAVGVGIVLLIVTGMSFGQFATRLRTPAVNEEAPVNRIAVLYFNDTSPDKQLGYLVEGLTSALIDQLGKVRQIKVISENGVRPFRGDSISVDSIASLLDVGAIVGGTVTQSGGMLRVHMEIVDAHTGIALRTEKIERPVGELFALLDDISDEMSAYLREAVGDEVKLQRYQRETNSVAAWQAMLKAQESFDAADALFDAGDGAEAHRLFTETEELLTRTIRLDGKWSAPRILIARIHLNRAFLALQSGDFDAQKQHLAAAQAAIDHAVRMDPRSSAALEQRGRIQYTKWALLPLTATAGDSLLKRAEADFTEALALDGDNARAASGLSTLYETLGRFADARRAAQRALDADAYLEDAEQIVVRLFAASFEMNDDEAAGHWCDETKRRFPGKWVTANCDLILLGWGGNQNPDARKALYLLETFGEADHPTMRDFVRPRLAMLAAVTVARSGDMVRATSMLEEARKAGARDPQMLYHEAAFWYRAGDERHAAALMRRYLAQNPKARPRLENGRMFRPQHGANRTAAGN